MEVFLPTDLFEKPQIKKLLKRYKHGVAIYIFALCAIHRAGGRLERNESFTELLAQQFNLPVELIRKVINYCIKLELLLLEDNILVFSGTLKL